MPQQQSQRNATHFCRRMRRVSFSCASSPLSENELTDMSPWSGASGGVGSVENTPMSGCQYNTVGGGFPPGAAPRCSCPVGTRAATAPKEWSRTARIWLADSTTRVASPTAGAAGRSLRVRCPASSAARCLCASMPTTGVKWLSSTSSVSRTPLSRPTICVSSPPSRRSPDSTSSTPR